MGKKRRHQSNDDQPSFAALNRMHEEVLELRREVEAEEAVAGAAGRTARPHAEGNQLGRSAAVIMLYRRSEPTLRPASSIGSRKRGSSRYLYRDRPAPASTNGVQTISSN